jgi:hypothetical protein
MHKFSTSRKTLFYYVGPPIEEGPLPALFYFALSAEESLKQDPYNQLVVFLTSSRIRIFSADLPFHGKGYLSKDAMSHWSKELAAGNDIISTFVNEMALGIEELLAQGVLLAHHIAACGLSRGAFIATHLAARKEVIRTILGFAPLTSYSFLKEMLHVPQHPLFDALDLKHLAKKLYDRKIRYYIGNHDTRVGTHACFQFFDVLVQTALHHQVRSPSIELRIVPSIGHMGHGTAKGTFAEGSEWLTKELAL